MEGLAPDSVRARVREPGGAENDFATVIEELSSPAPVASLPMLEDMVYDLHVLLGHRLPSIPARSTLRLAGARSLWPRTEESDAADEYSRK
jgi:hypothetical protein